MLGVRGEHATNVQYSNIKNMWCVQYNGVFLSLKQKNYYIQVTTWIQRLHTGWVCLYEVLGKNGTPLQYSCLENPMDGGPGGLQSMGSQRVRHDWATSLSLFTFMHWRRKWQPTLVFLPGESQGRGSLVGCRLWGRTESDTTEVT